MTRILLPFLTIALIGALCGCVERRLYFRTNVETTPVRIELDGEVIGHAPTDVEFELYGQREWVARAIPDGEKVDEQPRYEIAYGTLTLERPWYQYFPFDFFAEVVIPWTIYDDHEVFVLMVPLVERDANELLDKAEEYREKHDDSPEPANEKGKQ